MSTYFGEHELGVVSEVDISVQNAGLRAGTQLHGTWSQLEFETSVIHNWEQQDTSCYPLIPESRYSVLCFQLHPVTFFEYFLLLFWADNCCFTFQQQTYERTTLLTPAQSPALRGQTVYIYI